MIMRKKIEIIILGGLLGMTTITHAINPDQEYILFFEKYKQLSNESDPKGMELYADNAKLHQKQITPDGIEQSMSMSGKKLKELFLENQEMLQKLGYTSNYSDVKVTRSQNSAKISATRYSTKNCFTDRDYYMVVSRGVDKQLYITEEYSTSAPQNLCKESIKDDLPLQLTFGAKMINKNLPMQVDRETNLEHVEAQGKELTLNYRLIHITSADMPAEWVQAMEVNGVPEIVKGVCDNIKMKELLNKGAQLNLKYLYKDNVPLTKIKMTKQDCNI